MPTVNLTARLALQMFGLGRGKCVCRNTAAECRAGRDYVLKQICALHTKGHQHTQSTLPSRPSDEAPRFCVGGVLLPFAWQKVCVISDKV